VQTDIAADNSARIRKLERELAIWRRVAGGDLPRHSERGRAARRYYLKAQEALFPKKATAKTLKKIKALAADTRGNANVRAVAAAMAKTLEAGEP
jgi:predicted ArsR family transcriptional regulator